MRLTLLSRENRDRIGVSPHSLWGKKVTEEFKMDFEGCLSHPCNTYQEMTTKSPAREKGTPSSIVQALVQVRHLYPQTRRSEVRDLPQELCQ